METSVHASSVDELKRLTVLQRALHDKVTSDGVMLEALEHLTREELQIKFILVTRTTITSTSTEIRAA